MLEDDSLKLATELNASAWKLAAKGRLRLALDEINRAIRAAPDYPHSYALRSRIFETMGMDLPAEADRDHALRLAREGGYDEEEVFAPPPEARRSGRSLPSLSGVSLSLPRIPAGFLVAVVAVALAGVVALGIAMGIAAFLGDDDDAVQLPPGVTPTPAGATVTPPPVDGATPTPSPEPAPGLPNVAGDPYSLGRLDQAWTGRGMRVTERGESDGFSGFSADPTEATLARGGDAAQVAVFIYPTREAAQAEWNLTPGQRPVPLGDRTVPVHDTIWWNANVVVLVRSATGDILTDALDAFLTLGG